MSLSRRQRPFQPATPLYFLLSLTPLLSFLPTSHAYSFNIASTPQQCSNLTFTITGSGGQPPFRALIVPFGATPLANAIEVRKILDVPFGNEGEEQVSFQLPYPENSQFIAVVSDANGFGTGGTSVAATVLQSSNSGCFNASQAVSPNFFFNIDPANQLVQCSSPRLWWDPSTVQGNVTFVGVIPGGDSFAISPNGPLTTVSGEGVGFNWTAAVVAGNQVLIVAGDQRGAGTGGSNQFTVAAGLNPSSSCLNTTSPSSTPGSPAGGSYPTNINGSGTGGGGGGSNVGAIVGGVIGGIAGLIALGLLLLFFRRRRRLHKQQARSKERPDLFTDEDDARRGSGDADREDRSTTVDPYIVPTEASIGHPTDGDGRSSSQYRLSAYDPHMSERDRRLSGMSATTGTSDVGMGAGGAAGAAGAGRGAGTVTSATRKSGIGPSLRPVNIIQHEDMGMAPEGEDEAEGEQEPETVELPPAYTSLSVPVGGSRAPQATAGAGGSGAGAAPPEAAAQA